MTRLHQPVLYHEVLTGLQPRSGGRYIDGTLGAGGHAAGILERSAPDGRLLGLDRDPTALAVARDHLAPFGERVTLLHSSYIHMAEVTQGFAPVDGIVLDLGLSSLQLDDPTRGFAFRHAGPLDMRFDPHAELTAAVIVNEWPLADLADIIFEYGEERQSRQIAQAIGQARPVRDTQHLAEVVARAIGRRAERGEHLHPATRTFQALRIAVNGELDAVDAVLPQAVSLLRPGGRLAIIAFHSLEDRRVKNFFRDHARVLQDGVTRVPSLKEITRKPLSASAEEIGRNPRARSAKLRIAEKL